MSIKQDVHTVLICMYYLFQHAYKTKTPDTYLLVYGVTLRSDIYTFKMKT